MILAMAIGFALGSLPTADLVARIAAVDLRSEGSGNPGTANAIRVAGLRVGLTVLALDLFKGAGAAFAGLAIDGDRTAIMAAVAAVAGQIHNPWFGLRGGKGLGVTAGTAVVLWPAGSLVVAAVAATATWAFRTGWGGLVTLAAFLGLALTWAWLQWPVAWGIPADDGLVWYALGIVALATPKFVDAVGGRG